MPSLRKLIRIGTLPETRRAIVVAARSDALRDLRRRARSDRTGLLRDLARPAATFRLVRDVVRHPAARELAAVSYLLLPSRFVPVGWAASWLVRRVPGRFIEKSSVPAGQTKRPRGPHVSNVIPRRGGRLLGQHLGGVRRQRHSDQEPH